MLYISFYIKKNTWNRAYDKEGPFVVVCEKLKVSSNSAGVSACLVKFSKAESTVKSAGEHVTFPTLFISNYAWLSHDLPKLTLLARSKERSNEGGYTALTFSWIPLKLSRTKAQRNFYVKCPYLAYKYKWMNGYRCWLMPCYLLPVR